MITLKEIENTNSIKTLKRIHKNEGLSFGYRIYDFLISEKLDFEVYLPSKGFNLQRPYVWNEFQQDEFIWSVLLSRSIPPFVFIQHEFDKYLIIDGKQRLITLKRFMLNEFPIHYQGEKIYWNDLDKDAKSQINLWNKFTCNTYYSYDDDPITDDEKIIIFNFYNFAGTPQDESHREKLLNSLTVSQ